MKTKYIPFILTACAVVLSSCDRTDPYWGGDVFNSGDGAFVTLDFLGGVSIREDAGTFQVPVRVLGNHGNFSVTVQTIDGTAKNGADFTIVEPATGVLAFGEDDIVKYITLGIARGNVGEYTEPGTKDFQISLTSSTGGIELGSVRKATATINDADHPLVDIIGGWNASANDGSGIGSWTMTLMPVAGDLEKLRINGIGPHFVDGYYVDPDNPEKSYDYTYVVTVTGEEGSRQFSIPFGKEMKTPDDEGNILSLWGYDGKYVYNSGGDLVFTQQEDGSFLIDDGWGYAICVIEDDGISAYDVVMPDSFSMSR